MISCDHFHLSLYRVAAILSVLGVRISVTSVTLVVSEAALPSPAISSGRCNTNFLSSHFTRFSLFTIS